MDTTEFQKLLKNRFGAFKTAPRGEFRIPCPTCDRHDARKMKRYISPNNFYSKCWICEKVLKRDDLLGEKLEFDRVELPPEIEHPQAREMPCKTLIPINALPLDHPAVKFLHKDHLYDLDNLATKYKVGFIPADGGDAVHFTNGDVNTRGSIIFPVQQNKKLVGWQCRFLPPFVSKKMKYFHVFPKGNYLYNFDQARQFKDVVVVEGIKKAFKLPNAVATLGKGISPNQINLLQYWDKVTLLLDGDEKTQDAAMNILSQIKALPKDCKNVDLRKYGFPSPDEMTSEQVKMVVEEAWK